MFIALMFGVLAGCTYLGVRCSDTIAHEEKRQSASARWITHLNRLCGLYVGCAVLSGLMIVGYFESSLSY